MDWETKISAKLPCMDYPRSACSMTWFSLSGQVCFATGTLHRVLTLLLLGVVVLLVNMHSVIYGVRQQLKGVHHLNVSPLLLPDQSSDHWATQDVKTSHYACWVFLSPKTQDTLNTASTSLTRRHAYLASAGLPVSGCVSSGQICWGWPEGARRRRRSQWPLRPWRWGRLWSRGHTKRKNMSTTSVMPALGWIIHSEKSKVMYILSDCQYLLTI